MRISVRAAVVAALVGGLGVSGWAAAPPGLHPVVLLSPGGDPEASGLVLGAWEGGRWLPTKSFAGRFPKAAQWRVQALGGQSALVRSPSPLETNGAPCEDTGFLALPPTPTPGQYALATSPALNTRPRPVDVLPTSSATYQSIVKAELLRRGLKAPVVQVRRIVRADLDGNGTQEVVLEAWHYRGETPGPGIPPPHAGAGDYSLLLLRWVKSGQPQTTVLGESVFTRDEKDDTDWQMPTLYELAGIADLNGDGRMELVVNDAYYEGSGASVLEWTPGSGPKVRLSEGCGA